MIIRARTVVTMDRAPIENGAVAVSGNRIVDVGAFEDVKARNAGDHLDLGAKVLVSNKRKDLAQPRLRI